LRHEFTNQYIKQLSKLDDEIFELPAWRVEKNTYPIRYPVLVKDPVALRQYAWQHRVMLGDWYDVPVAPRGVDQIAAGYSSGSCPNAEGICKRIVNLPLHLNLAEQDVYKIVSLLKDFYGL